MYRVLYGRRALHDPRTGPFLSGLSIRVAANEAGSCEFVVHSSHPMRHSLALRDVRSPVTAWDGDQCIFDGFAWEAEQDEDDDLRVTCRGALALLGDTLVRPYSTVEGEAALLAPASPSALFEWYVAQHNSRVGERQRFEVGANDGDLLDANAHVYRASSQLPRTSDEIRDKLLDPLGGHLFCRSEGGVRYLDWCVDGLGAGGQTVDFGVNLIDFMRLESADGVASVLRPVGGMPDGEDEPVTVAGLPDGIVAPGVIKLGDAIYSEAAVAAYGWVEAAHQSEALTPDGLLASAVDALGESLATAVTIEVGAIDLSLLDRAVEPLVPGRLVRVRASPYGFDRLMAVVGARIDCVRPENSRYTLGEPQQSHTQRVADLEARVAALEAGG